MSNVIEFTKRPTRVSAPTPAAAPSEELCKASTYSLVELLDFEYTDTDIIDENGQIYTATPESHWRMMAYFDAFGFDYENIPASRARSCCGMRSAQNWRATRRCA